IGYAKEGEPLVIFGRDFLVTSKSRVDFGIGEMHIDLTMLEEMKDIDIMLDALIENLEEVGSSNGDLVKMGKASRNKNNNVNKLTPPPQIKIEEIPPISAIVPPSPIYHPLTKKQKEKVKEALDLKVNGTVEMSALADTGASVSVLPYCIFKNLGLGDPKPYNSNLTMVDNTQAKAMGEVKNVRSKSGIKLTWLTF
ncbi:reverse transcriptase domain-containing protein, partial [Tanacetum coccineum]